VTSCLDILREVYGFKNGEALRQLLFEKGVITEEEFIDRFRKLDREMK